MATRDISANTSSETMTQPAGAESPVQHAFERRSFLKGLGVAGATLSAGALLAGESEAEDRSINRGDAAILRFAAAAEILETDLWQQYAELALGNEAFQMALGALDGDMPTYVN